MHRVRFTTRIQARPAVFEFVEVFYNRQRRHSTIGMVSPAEFERDYARPHVPGGCRKRGRKPSPTPASVGHPVYRARDRRKCLLAPSGRHPRVLEEGAVVGKAATLTPSRARCLARVRELTINAKRPETSLAVMRVLCQRLADRDADVPR